VSGKASFDEGADDPLRLIGGKVVDGRYRVDAVLGRGGMGAVYQGTDERLNRAVAIKALILAGFKDSDGILLRFAQEIEVLAKLKHPAIPMVFDVGVHRLGAMEIPIAVMELVQGRSLHAVLTERGRLPWREALEYVLQILDALRAAHKLGILHRDLKPENIMITAEGRAILLDFGIAKLRFEHDEGQARRRKLTATGNVIGTPHYIAPEVWRALPDVDERADLYAIGCVLYRLLTGRPVWNATNPFQLVKLVLEQEPTDIRTLVAALPDHVVALVQRLMRKDRALRFHSAEEVQSAIRRCLSAGDGPLRAGEGDETVEALPAAGAAAPTVNERVSNPAPAEAADTRKLAAERRSDASAFLERWSGSSSGPSAAPPTPPRRAFPTLAIVAGFVAAVGLVAVGIWGMSRATQSKAPESTPPAAVAPASGGSVAPMVVPTEGEVRVTTEPSGAAVTSAGRLLGRTPITVPGRLGESLDIKLSLEGYQTQLQTISFDRPKDGAQFLLEPTETPKRSAKSKKERRSGPVAKQAPKAPSDDEESPANPFRR
jgi:serine/threonine protein kinase